MDRWKGKVALVTGGSSGIGSAIVKAMAKYELRVITIGRRMQKLQELAQNIKDEYNIDIYIMRCDIRQEEDIFKVFKWASDTFNGIDVFVNNAAIIANENIIGKSLFCFFFFYSSLSSSLSGLL